MSEQTRISGSAAAAMRTAIRLAGGREVCFVASLDDAGIIVTARVVSRGDSRSVLALPGVARRGELLVHNHPSGDLSPSDADQEVAHAFHMNGVGFAIVNNAVSDLYVVVEVPGERAFEALDAEEITRELSRMGRIGRVLHEYEERPSQLALTRQIVKLYNNEGIGVLEAGTGVGKSLAYLLPALRWSAVNGDRTVVTTNTINLQEQIMGNDLPLLERALSDQKVRFTLLKGWRNYVCLQRLENATVDSSSLFVDDHTAELTSLRDWADRTDNGSLSDMLAQPTPEVWDEVAADSDVCTRHRCKHFEQCFVFKARRAAAQADVVIVNHHLLLADVAVRRLQQNWTDAAVLPAYDRLVIDEGHHLEDAAASHLGQSVSRRGVARLLSRLDRNGKGLLTTLLFKFQENPGLVSSASEDLVRSRLQPAVESARRLATEMFDMLDTHLQLSRLNTLRVTPEFARHQLWRDGLERILDNLGAELQLLAGSLDLLRERLTTKETGEEDLPVIAELASATRRLLAAGDAVEVTLRPDARAEPSVRWFETRGRDRNVALTTVPLDLSGVLREDLFRKVKTTIVTSATLSINGSFDFTNSRLGLNRPDVEPVTAILPSSFHFEDQTLLVVPTDLPLPAEFPEEHRAAVVEAVLTLCELSDGGVFVLCTSHRDVRAIAGAVRARAGVARWPLLVHGESDQRDVLLRRFRDSGRALLIGTASFWEGVDVRGDALRGLVIVRLPFKVPTEPMTAANCEAIADAGGDPFTEYLLPHAVLRLKQGFGRLIRSATDWGAVIVTDSRAAVRGYGESFVDSLPPARRAIGPWTEVAAELKKFYNQRRSV